MAVSGQIKTTISITNTGASDLSSPTETITDGDAINKMDIVWSDQRTLTATTSENLDLAGGLTDTYGNTLTFAKVKYLFVSAAAANNGIIQVGGAASNAFVNWVANSSDILQVRAGGWFDLAAPDADGYAVTAGTGDILKINNTGAAAGTYNIAIGGVSA